MKEDFKDCFSTTSVVKVGEKEFIVGEPIIDEIIAFQVWCREENKKEIRELANEFGKTTTLREIKEMISDPASFIEKASSIEGVLYLIKLIIKRLNKDFDEDYFMKHITSEKLGEIDGLINREEDEEVKNSSTEKQEPTPMVTM